MPSARASRKAGSRGGPSPAARFDAHVMRVAEAFDAGTFSGDLHMRPGKMRVSLAEVLNDWSARMSVNRFAEPKTRVALAAASVRTLATLLHGIGTSLSSIQLAAIANLKPVTIVQAAKYSGPASRYAVRIKDFLSVIVTVNGRVQEFAKMMADNAACAATLTALSEATKASVAELKRRQAMLQVQSNRRAKAVRRQRMLERRGMVAHRVTKEAEEEANAAGGKKEAEEAPVLPPASSTGEGKWADEAAAATEAPLVASAPARAPAPKAAKAGSVSRRRPARKRRKGRKPSMRAVGQISARAPKAVVGTRASHAGRAVAVGAA